MADDGPTAALDAGLRALIGYNLKRGYLLIQRAVSRELAPLGLRPPSFAALVCVADNPGLTQSRLAAALDIKRSAMVAIVDELEQAGLVGRHPVPGDRRRYALRASAEGARVRARAWAAIERAEAALLGGLGERESRLLRDLFRRIEAAAPATGERAAKRAGPT